MYIYVRTFLNLSNDRSFTIPTNGLANKHVNIFWQGNHSLIVSHPPAHWPCTEEQCWDPQRQVKLQIQENTFTWRTQCVPTPPLMNSIGMQLEMKLIPGILIAHRSSTQVSYLRLKSVLLLPSRDHSTPTALQLPMLLHTCQSHISHLIGRHSRPCTCCIADTPSVCSL